MALWFGTGDEDGRVGEVVAVAEVLAFVGAVATAPVFGSACGGPAGVVLAEFGCLKLGEADARPIQSGPEDQARLEPVVGCRILAAPAEGVGDQAGEHGLRGKVADDPKVVDGLAAEGHEGAFEAKDEVERHVSTRPRARSGRSIHPGP